MGNDNGRCGLFELEAAHLYLRFALAVTLIDEPRDGHHLLWAMEWQQLRQWLRCEWQSSIQDGRSGCCGQLYLRRAEPADSEAVRRRQRSRRVQLCVWVR